MKLTDTQKTILTVAGVGAGLYIGYKLINNINMLVSPPINPEALPNPPGCDLSTWEQRKVRKKFDEIYNLLSGANLFMYPDEVNAIAGFSNCENMFGIVYFDSTYGMDVKDLIEGEWQMFGEYTPALNALEKTGYYD